MMYSSSFFLALAAVIAFALAESVTYNYPSFGASNQADFQFNLGAPANNNPPPGVLVLTPSSGNQAGSIFIKKPISLQGDDGFKASFSTRFSFRMEQPGSAGDSDGGGADGIVFIVNSVSGNGGSYGGGIGYEGIRKSIGIEFDTYNNGYPTDIDGNHIGIDINGNVQSVASVPYPTRFNNGNLYYVWVDFNGDTQLIEIRISPSTTRPAVAQLARTIDLVSILGTPNVYVGFSAATGGAWERHVISSWIFTNEYAPNATAVVSTSTCGNGIVETGESCDGGACCTASCTFAATSQTCRASNGACDVAETCTGSSSTCPADSFASSAITCRASNGVCDVAETCTGSSATCPIDAFASSVITCRTSNGVCDVSETCSGFSASCPADSFASTSTECRSSIGPCDPAESCTGSSASCPADVSGHFETACAGLTMTLNGHSYSWLNYDVISFNGFVANTGDIEGRAAIRHSAHVGAGWSVGYETHSLATDNTLPYAMIVGDDFSFGSGAVYPDGSNSPFIGQQENLFVGAEFSAPSYLADRRTGSCPAVGCLDSQFEAVRQCYGMYQSEISSHADNVAKVIQWSGLSVTCNSRTDSTYYLTLTPQEMTQYTYVTFADCSSTARWVITISGNSDVTFTGASFPASSGSIIYNVLGSGRQINVHDTNLNGNLLAPFNNLHQTSGVITGKVIANDINMSLQLNRAQCFTPQ